MLPVFRCSGRSSFSRHYDFQFRRIYVRKKKLDVHTGSVHLRRRRIVRIFHWTGIALSFVQLRRNEKHRRTVSISVLFFFQTPRLIGELFSLTFSQVYTGLVNKQIRDPQTTVSLSQSSDPNVTPSIVSYLTEVSRYLLYS